MPYKRRYPKKRYRRRKRGFYGHANKSLALAARGLAVAYGVKRLMNVEFKHHQAAENGTLISNVGQVLPLSIIDQGDTSETRDGNQIKCMNIRIRYTLKINASATNTFVRVILVRDGQTNGALFTIADLLENTGANVMNSFLNLDNKFRFNVLYNRVHRLSNTTGNDIINAQIFKKLGTKIRYTGSTSTIADQSSKSFTLVVISSEATNTPAFSMLSRLRYVDN